MRQKGRLLCSSCCVRVDNVPNLGRHAAARLAFIWIEGCSHRDHRALWFGLVSPVQSCRIKALRVFCSESPRRDLCKVRFEVDAVHQHGGPLEGISSDFMGKRATAVNRSAAMWYSILSLARLSWHDAIARRMTIPCRTG